MHGRWTWSPSHRHALQLVPRFDFVGQLQWLGLRSCRFHVGAGAFGAWLCLWEITRVFGKNNLVPTVTASFDVLEAGDMVEGCSCGFSLGFWRVRTVRNFLHVCCLFRSTAARLVFALGAWCRLCEPRHESPRMLCDVLVRGGPLMVLLLLTLCMPIVSLARRAT